MRLTRSQKQSICEELKHGRASVVAHRFGISKSRVYQLKKEDPANWGEDKIMSAKQSESGLRFRAEHSHLNDLNIQRRIAESSKAFVCLAEEYGASLYAINRIHSHLNHPRILGRPRGLQRSKPKASKPKAPLTPEQIKAKIARTRATTKLWQKRWRDEHPELASERNHAAYERRKEKHRAYMRDYYSKHRDRCLAQNREWKKANPEKAAEYKKRWVEQNPDKVQAKNQRQRN